MQDLLTKV